MIYIVNIKCKEENKLFESKIKMDSEVSTPNDDACAAASMEKFDINNVPKSKSLNDLIDNLHHTFAHDSIKIDFVVKLLENYESNHRDWSKYVKYDQHK
jgi:hypothetical protein